MRDRLLRRHSRPERQTDGEPWDRPADQPMDHWITDAGEGPAWDRPAEDEFAPPLDEQALHWAFQPPSTGGAAAPDRGAAHEREALADDAPAEEAPLHWAFREPEITRRGFDENYEWDERLPLVSVPRTDTGRPPRDPAQAGMFDPDDAFAPVVEGLTARGPATPRPADPTPAARESDASSVSSPASDSVFGDMFDATVRPAEMAAAPPADFVMRPPATDPAISPPDPRSVSGPAPAGERDPLEWPPIPTGFLPPEAHELGEGGASTTERGGRRFAWPPPQPRISIEGAEETPESVSPGRARAAATNVPTLEAQQQLWPATAPAREPAAAAVAPAVDRSHFGPDIEQRPRRRGVALLTIAGTALAVIALLLLVLQLVASGMP